MKKTDNNKGMKECVSALMDGEVSEFEARRVLNEIDSDPSLREYWQNLQISSSVFRGESLNNYNSDITSRVFDELKGVDKKISREANSLSHHPLRVISTFFMGIFCIFAGSYFVDSYEENASDFSLIASTQIEDIISSSEALEVLKKATTGLNIKMEDIQSGADGQIFANYKSGFSNKPFRVILSPIKSLSNEKLISNFPLKTIVILSSSKGKFILDVEGDISQHEKSIILHNASFISDPLK